MTIQVELSMWQKKTQVTTLLDSGATDNLINSNLVKELGIATRKLRHPRTATNADGTLNKDGIITDYCVLITRRGTTTRAQAFFVTNLGKDRIILGYPWFHFFNPEIDWSLNKLKGEDISFETPTIFHQKKRRLEANNIAQQWAEKALAKQTPAKEIPKEYQRHAVVFDEEAAQRFPPVREEDHTITLKPDAPTTLDCKIYPLSPPEQEALKQFIDEELKKGYIIESKSPYASPFFYRKKKDGKLQPIIDYRTLNSWTVRDTYPLPLINMILEQLQGKSLFTKFDI